MGKRFNKVLINTIKAKKKLEEVDKDKKKKMLGGAVIGVGVLATTYAVIKNMKEGHKEEFNHNYFTEEDSIEELAQNEYYYDHDDYIRTSEYGEKEKISTMNRLRKGELIEFFINRIAEKQDELRKFSAESTNWFCSNPEYNPRDEQENEMLYEIKEDKRYLKRLLDSDNYI